MGRKGYSSTTLPLDPITGLTQGDCRLCRGPVPGALTPFPPADRTKDLTSPCLCLSGKYLSWGDSDFHRGSRLNRPRRWDPSGRSGRGSAVLVLQLGSCTHTCPTGVSSPTSYVGPPLTKIDLSLSPRLVSSRGEWSVPQEGLPWGEGPYPH